MLRLTSFSITFPSPIFPGSNPPCPASTTTVNRFPAVCAFPSVAVRTALLVSLPRIAAPTSNNSPIAAAAFLWRSQSFKKSKFCMITHFPFYTCNYPAPSKATLECVANSYFLFHYLYIWLLLLHNTSINALSCPPAANLYHIPCQNHWELDIMIGSLQLFKSKTQKVIYER